MVAENKFSKYLIYAIGEIVLVVIGILIALQINEWNDHRKEIALENEYYCRLLEDVQLDKEQMENLIQLAEDRLVASNQSIRLLIDEKSEKIAIATQIKLATKAIYSDFEPNNSAYQDLKSGANLNIITDKSVIKTLNHYFNRVDELKSIIMINGKYAVDLAFAHDDNFANGSHRAAMVEGRLQNGLDENLKEAISSFDDGILSSQMRKRLLHESVEFAGVNSRQVELYDMLLQEIDDLKLQLEKKCETK